MTKLMMLIVLVSAALFSQTYADPDLDRLARKLQQGSVSFVTPGTTTVSVGYGLAGFDFDETNSLLTSHIWERYTWKDSRLQWNPSEYGSYNTIRLPSYLVWTPDIVLYNPYAKSDTSKELNAVISNDGSVTWVSPSIHRTRCTPLSGKSFNCTLLFGSWTYDASLLPLTLTEGNLDLSVLIPTYNQYDVTGTSLYLNTTVYDCCPKKPYTAARVSLVIRKKSGAKFIH
jgi:hypothetical protein